MSAAPTASEVLSKAAEKQAQAKFVAPYDRVAGRFSRYEDIPIPSKGAAAAHAASMTASLTGRAGAGTVGATGGAGAGTRTTGGAGPSPVTSISHTEYKATLKMNVMPRHGEERLLQECGA